MIGHLLIMTPLMHYVYCVLWSSSSYKFKSCFREGGAHKKLDLVSFTTHSNIDFASQSANSPNHEELVVPVINRLNTDITI